MLPIHLKNKDILFATLATQLIYLHEYWKDTKCAYCKLTHKIKKCADHLLYLFVREGEREIDREHEE